MGRIYRVDGQRADLLKLGFDILDSQTINESKILDKDELRVITYKASHSLIKPVISYRFNYGDRSIDISGDSLTTEKIMELLTEADLIPADAMSLYLEQGA